MTRHAGGPWLAASGRVAPGRRDARREYRPLPLEEEEEEGSSDEDTAEESFPSRTSCGDSRRACGAPREWVRSHGSFVSDVLLALSVAFWVTLFALPAYNRYARYLIFGQEDLEIDGRWVKLCNGSRVGSFFLSGRPEQPVLVHEPPEGGPRPVRLWCGLVPRGYLAYVGQAAQFAVFSVRANTGTTIQNVYRGLIGTWWATTNVWLMTLLFPHGGRIRGCAVEGVRAALCPEGSKIYQDPGYMPWVCWVDVMVVVFMFLASNSHNSTKKFGLSCHLYLMMEFMDPARGPQEGAIRTGFLNLDLDSELTAVNIATVAGACVAILATLTPYPRLTHVQRDAKHLVESIGRTWEEAISYYCQSKRSAKRFSIEGQILSLRDRVCDNKCRFETSRWETCNLSFYDDLRAFYESLIDCMLKLDSVTYGMMASILFDEFSDKHHALAERIAPSMRALLESSQNLLEQCVEHCWDADVNISERRSIEGQILKVHDRQQALHRLYTELMREQPFVVQDFVNDNIFVLSLSALARMTAELAQDIINLDQKLDTSRGSRCSCCNYCARFCGRVLEYWSSTWFPEEPLLSRSNLRTVAANFFPITICFYMGYAFHHSIFVAHSSTMAGTLALLIHKTDQATFRLNMHRLMGVTWGQILPLSAMSMLDSVCPCGRSLRPLVHSAMLLIFVFVFLYTAYSSKYWNYVAMLIAGFGVVALLDECAPEVEAVSDNNYKTIAQVTVAIFVLTLVDALLASRAPRDVAVERVKELECLFERCFNAFFSQDPEGLERVIEETKTSLEAAEEHAPNCDPALQVVTCWRRPFRNDLYTGALAKMRLLLSDLQMLSMVSGPSYFRTPSSSDPLWPLTKPSIQALMQEDIVSGLRASFEALVAVLTHDCEGEVTDSRVTRLQGISGLLELSGVQEFFGDAARLPLPAPAPPPKNGLTEEPRARLASAVRALRMANKHVGRIGKLSLQSCAG